MKRTTSKARALAEKHPDKPEVEAIADDLDTYHALDAIAKQEGGQILITSLMNDVVASIETLIDGYKKLSHPELQAQCATLAANLAIVRALTRAEANKKLADAALSDALKE